jgi:pimeloyl-ACP methyl ester carboxylesterase
VRRTPVGMSPLAAHIKSSAHHRVLGILVSVAVLAVFGIEVPLAQSTSSDDAVRVWTIHYRSHDGVDRLGYVLLPSWYGPADDPPIPVVISPHGRGASGLSNAGFWGNLPAVGGFGVINPDGMGRRLKRFSYGYSGQIDDLARMPSLAMKALPWLRIDRRRIYALGSSMGGQETLLLVARYPQLLAGAAALDSVTDLARRYRQLPTVPCNERCLRRWRGPYGYALQSSMRREVGGTPAEDREGYVARSPLAQARSIAFSGVQLQVWWSEMDRIVSDQRHQSEELVRRVRRLNPCAALADYVGTWAHSHEMRSTALLPIALVGFRLLAPGAGTLPDTVRVSTGARCDSNRVPTLPADAQRGPGTPLNS